jgi:hypothetical protein
MQELRQYVPLHHEWLHGLRQSEEQKMGSATSS